MKVVGRPKRVGPYPEQLRPIFGVVLALDRPVLAKSIMKHSR